MDEVRLELDRPESDASPYQKKKKEVFRHRDLKRRRHHMDTKADIQAMLRAEGLQQTASSWRGAWTREDLTLATPGSGLPASKTGRR